jgi:DNA-binding CsgD family transcriptional regulator
VRIKRKDYGNVQRTDLARALIELGGGLESAIDEVRWPAALLDSEGVIRWQNEAALALRGNHVGRHFSELVVPEEQREIRERVARIFCQGKPEELTINLASPAGARMSVHLTAAAVRSGRTIVGIFGLGYIVDRAGRSQQHGASGEFTQRQLQILRLLDDGRSTDQIAGELALSVTTVRNHIANILAILGVHSRLQAVVAARKAGLFGP